jgi:hypothetical protein
LLQATLFRGMAVTSPCLEQEAGGSDMVEYGVLATAGTWQEQPRT